MYRILGADGKQYGPASLEQMRKWIAESRVTAQTRVQEVGAGEWKTAAEFRGDFQDMAVRAFSEMTYYSALALERLGKKAAAKKLLRELLAYARQLAKTKAGIDYFATSLPTMLLFEDDFTG